MWKRGVVLAAAVAGVGSIWWPTYAIHMWILERLGWPPYRGAWILLGHVALDTMLPAVLCTLLWIALARWKLVPPLRESLRFRPPTPILTWGAGVGLAVAAGNIVLLAALAHAGALQGFAIAYVPPNYWDIAGNVVSNFYEELVTRGFAVVFLRVALGNTPAAVVLSSLAFGAGHTQYPVWERCYIALSGALQCVAYLRTRSLWAPYVAHEVYDLILDCAVRIG